MNANSNAVAFDNIDDLLNASMDDIEDLPPLGVPPTGHYNLEVTATREQSQDKKSEYIKFSYQVLAINEVKNPEELADAAEGMKFDNIFSPVKKDGTANTLSIGLLKQALAPFAEHFGTKRLGETIGNINKVTVAASLVRRQDKKDEDRYRFALKDVVVL
jgi:hypothetical protein